MLLINMSAVVSDTGMLYEHANDGRTRRSLWSMDCGTTALQGPPPLPSICVGGRTL